MLADLPVRHTIACDLQTISVERLFEEEKPAIFYLFVEVWIQRYKQFEARSQSNLDHRRQGITRRCIALCSRCNADATVVARLF